MYEKQQQRIILFCLFCLLLFERIWKTNWFGINTNVVLVVRRFIYIHFMVPLRKFAECSKAHFAVTFFSTFYFFLIFGCRRRRWLLQRVVFFSFAQFFFLSTFRQLFYSSIKWKIHKSCLYIIYISPYS